METPWQRLWREEVMGEGTNSGRCQGGARRAGDPGVAKETKGPGDTVGPEGQDGAAVMSSRGGARVPEE